MDRTTDRRDSAIVLLGGGVLKEGDFGALPDDALVIAADSGAGLAEALGLRVDTLIGDMDSIAPTALAALAALGTEVVVHPADKDATDAELALIHAASAGARRLVVLGAGGGRLDHQLALFSVLFREELDGIELELRLDRSRAYPLRAGRTLSVRCRVGSVVGLIPAGGDVHGATAEGLRWPLADESLSFAASRGVSNRAVAEEIRVSIGAGRLIVTVDDPDDAGAGSPTEVR